VTKVRALFLLTVIGHLCAVPAVLAQEEAKPTGFWFGGEVGYGAVKRTADQDPGEREGTLALSFKVGYRPNPLLLMGAEVGGWLLTAGDVNDPGLGPTLLQILAIAQFYPRQSPGPFIKAGGGFVSYNSNESGPQAEPAGTGWALTGGLGYDFAVSPRLLIGPLISYSWGRIGDGTDSSVFLTGRQHTAINVVLSVTWR
jgi:hypothetical protein